MRLQQISVLCAAVLQPSFLEAYRLTWTWNDGKSSNYVELEKYAERRDSIKGGDLPKAVRKMTLDEGEMFLPEYWTLYGVTDPPDDSKPSILQMKDSPLFLGDQREASSATNLTLFPALQAPLALHHTLSTTTKSSVSRFLRFPRGIFAIAERDYLCPSGSTVCADISHDNTCCPSETTCQSLPDGGVGCCAQGQTCSQQVSSCSDGESSCPSNLGGGCCIAGYSCVNEGCEAVSTATVIVAPTVTASPPPPPPSTSTSAPTASASTLISTSTHTDITSTTSTVTSSPSSSLSSSPSSTPSSASSSREAAPIAPIRPISGAASTSTTTTAPPTTITPSTCPTGFYACSAHYLGGCCRIGRDCSSTSCPAPSSSLVLNSNGVSIGVAPAVTTRLGEDGCALGWFRCGQDGGGGCCPSGYACGESCTATGVNIGAGQIGTATVAKNNGVGSGRIATVNECVWKVAWALLSVLLFLRIAQ